MSSATTQQAATKQPQKQNGLIQQLETILGKPLGNEARQACEAMLMNVMHIAIQSASYTSEAARERATQVHDIAAAQVATIVAEASKL